MTQGRWYYRVPQEDDLKKLLLWLESSEEHCGLIFEEDLSKFLQGRESIVHSRLKWVHVVADTLPAVCRELAWEYLFVPFTAFFPSSQLRQKGKLCFEIFSQIQASVQMVASDYKDLGHHFLDNLFANVRSLPTSRLFKGLMGAFKDVPALICGAGPSFQEVRELLPHVENRALIFAGGSTLARLSEMGLLPHFSAHIDPHPVLPKTWNHACFMSPYFYQSRSAERMTLAAHGEKIWVQGDETYPLEKFFEERLTGENEMFDGGWNVSTFLIKIALLLGCNPIVLVGVDFSSPHKADIDTKNVQTARNARGEKIYMKADGLMAAEWLEQLAVRHPKISWWRGTQGGLPLPHIPFKSLSQLLPMFPQRDLSGLAHEAMQNCMTVGVSSEVVQKLLSEISVSRKACAQFINELLRELEKSFPQPPSGSYALLERELEEELFYQKFLKPLWMLWKPAILRQVPKNIPEPYRAALNSWLFMQNQTP